MRSIAPFIALATAGALLAGCAVVPTGPSVRVLPTPGKPLDVFAAEDQYCRGYAQQMTGNAQEASNTAAVGSAVIGTALGATAGALLGGRNGAAAGAGVGLVAGSAVGAGESNRTAWSMQRRYDYAYEQCMYSKGNVLPGQPVPYYGAQMPPPPPPPPPPQ
jgi:uncharacterized protein YcfJ